MSMLVICGYCLYSINYECLCEKVVFSDCYSSYWSFPYLAVYDQLSGLSITPEELNLTL